MIRLEPINREDLRKIEEWNVGKTSDFLLQWAGPLYKYPLTIEQLEDYYNISVKEENPCIRIFKIIMLDNEEMIGTIEIREIDKLNKVGRVGRFLLGNEDIRGKGIGTSALEAILDIGFRDLNYEKITLGVFDFNAGAIKCYEKVGFIKERITMNARETPNGFWNLIDMGITKEKWFEKQSKSMKRSDDNSL
jgi:RimJ/RimL family protein N-acetyltransferase